MPKTHDYRIYYVNIELHHQYGISVAESQMFLLTKCPTAAMSKEKHLPFAGYKKLMMCPLDTIMQLLTASDQIKTVASFLNVQIRHINFYFYILVYITIYYFIFF